MLTCVRTHGLLGTGPPVFVLRHYLFLGLEGPHWPNTVTVWLWFTQAPGIRARLWPGQGSHLDTNYADGDYVLVIGVEDNPKSVPSKAELTE